MSFGMSFELGRLKVRVRNQVRAILAAEEKEAVILVNLLRDKASARELIQTDKIFRLSKGRTKIYVPDYFPKEPNTTESFLRLSRLTIEKQVEQLRILVVDNNEKLLDMLMMASVVSRDIIAGDYCAASEKIETFVGLYGYSHFILRKAALIRALNDSGQPLPEIDRLIGWAGGGTKNIITSSLLQCYQEDQSFLVLKRSIMSLAGRGKGNKFTRDMARVPFHPHAKCSDDLCDLIQSNLQSSLIDAVIIAKINRNMLSRHELLEIEEVFNLIDRGACSIDDISAIYMGKNDPEDVFYKHSSAWYECEEVVRYRELQDHFYDDPDARYFEINDDLLNRVGFWVADLRLSDLAGGSMLARHGSKNLAELERSGFVTRSSVFNYLVHKSRGFSEVPENDLFEIMGRTRDLSRTIHSEYIRNLAGCSPSRMSQLLLYLLVAKKNKIDSDGYRVRRLLQQLVIEDSGGSIIEFVKALDGRSGAVADYVYDVCTEDFIAMLPHIIDSASKIIETRASLHRWMGEKTGDRRFTDRARTLLIDQQINSVRNEIDDNRIYVDIARFSEWVSDSLIPELNAVFTGIEHNGFYVSDTDEEQLVQIIDRCYGEFCSNNIFGISSYLGRRIRHGTFKGHLFYGVVSIEKASKYSGFLSDKTISAKWLKWRSGYESVIDEIIRKKLHVESINKREGILKPTIASSGKIDIASACARALIKDFTENRSAIDSVQFLGEYCWRLAEVDLKVLSAFLKGQKAVLQNTELLGELKQSASLELHELAKEFSRDLLFSISERLKVMQGWFKRPLSVSPKASLSLLYKAVVAEVRVVFPDFEVDTSFEESEDIELVGGPYHVLYDAFYVVVYNAAKHGKRGGRVQRKFWLEYNGEGKCGAVTVSIESEIPDESCEADICERLKVAPGDDIENAQVYEDRSGIRKLYQLQASDKDFSIKEISCTKRMVNVCISYALEH